ncbi:hypothetical protein GCM10025873_25100 [Demequina sediminis]|nr:hypothetical protein GCM10025873_25100 [Demequina sediminis]
MFMHETYTMPTRAGTAAMWTYQRPQARGLVRNASQVFHSCDGGLSRLGKLNRASSVVPVPSNIVRVATDPASERLRWGIDQDAFVVGTFGHITEPRLLQLVPMLRAISEIRPITLAYVGKDVAMADRLRPEVRGRLVTFERPSPADVSRLLSTFDLALAPFIDGVSARRGSFAALVDHGVPTVTNRGANTDRFLVDLAKMGLFELSTNDLLAETAARLAASDPQRDALRTAALANRDLMPSRASTVEAVEACLPPVQVGAGPALDT